MKMYNKMREMAVITWIRIQNKGLKTDEGIDGILVSVGLCIIALLLCVVMKDSLKTFIESIVASLSSEASKILTGTVVTG